MNQRQPYYFERPRMAGDSLLNLGADDIFTVPSMKERYTKRMGTELTKNLKYKGDIMQALMGDRGTHLEREQSATGGMRGTTRGTYQFAEEER